MADISRIYPTDRRSMEEVKRLLIAEGIRLDKNLDYTCGIYDDAGKLIATGSCFGNTLRCFAVDHGHRGEGLLNTVISHLMDYQQERGNFHIFLYTKCSSARFFQDLGFHEIARVEDSLVFMENRRTGFSDCIRRFQEETAAKTGGAGGLSSAVVMNANPFTLGHQYLIEAAAKESDWLHLFLLSEDASLVPFPVRRKLLLAGTSHLSNLILHDSGPYIISQATFPSYFQKDDDDVSSGHALLDITIFEKIARALGISRRYVGEEPFSRVTEIYNRIMKEHLPQKGIDCIVLPRREADGQAVSASTVRRLLQTGDFSSLAQLVPASTLDFFRSEEAAPILDNIREARDIVHH